MKKSIFIRIFSTISALLCFATIMFAGALTTFVYEYSISEQHRILQSEADKISQSVALLNESYSKALEQMVYSSIIYTAKNNETSIILTDIEGNIKFCTDESLIKSVAGTVGRDIITTLYNEGRFAGLGSLGGIYASSVYTVGTPVILSNEQTSGYIFVSAPSPYLEGLLYSFRSRMFMAAATVLAISTLVAYFLSGKLVRPLQVIGMAVREYAKGNFNVRININTDDEVGELALAFNNMAVSLSRLEEMRSGFIANVSHDLKTPMTTIAGFVEGILDGTIPPEKQEHYLRIVSEEVRRLSRMVKGLLEIAQFESSVYVPNRTRFNLYELIETIITGFEQNLNKKNVYVEIHCSKKELYVLADHDMIFQVIYNLLDNAVKFVNNDGIITIRIEEDGKKVKCYIKNTGEGIAAGDIDMIFERFYKSDTSRSMDKNGTGLGLYIVRSIMAAHQESINVDSVEGKYCEFSFTLPIADK